MSYCLQLKAKGICDFSSYFSSCIQGVVSFAEPAGSPPGSTMEAEIPKTAMTNPITKGELSLHYPSIDSMFTLYQP